jgi:hypothetical protein
VEDTRFLLSELSLIRSQLCETGGAGYGNPTAGFDYLRHYAAFESAIQVFSGSLKSFFEWKIAGIKHGSHQKNADISAFQPWTLFTLIHCPRFNSKHPD